MAGDRLDATDHEILALLSEDITGYTVQVDYAKLDWGKT